MSEVRPDNRLNELTAQQWLRFTKTWYVHNPPPRKKAEKLHPAKYPEHMIQEFIEFFTKPGAVVLDPFLGTGSTLVACYQSQRNGIGIELQQKYATIARERIRVLEDQMQLTQRGARQTCKQLVLQGSCMEFKKMVENYSLPKIDLVITSPPYGDMLKKKGLVAKKREEEGLDTQYSDQDLDLGNMSYENFVGALEQLFLFIKPQLRERAHIVVILQNYMHEGTYITLAWDVANKLKAHFQFRGERIWCQDNKTLYPYGYRYAFVPNVHHHYCLIFRNL